MLNILGRPTGLLEVGRNIHGAVVGQRLIVKMGREMRNKFEALSPVTRNVA